MSTKNGPQNAVAPRNAVIVPLSRHGDFSRESGARILESLTHLGQGLPDSEQKKAEVAKKMEAFGRCLALLDSALEQHARRYGEGYYQLHDQKMGEQTRMNILLSYAIYTTDAVKALYAKVQERNDCGISSLFEKTLDSAAAALSDDFFSLGLESGIQRFRDLHPFLAASLRSCGLGDKVIEMPLVHKSLKQELLKRINATMDRLYGPETGPNEAA